MYNPEIGMQVVCIKQIDPHNLFFEKRPSIGQITTINNIYTDPDGQDYLWLMFVEFSEIPIAFDYTYFRPVKKTSIEVFSGLLNPTDEQIEKELKRLDNEDGDRKKEYV